MADVLPAGEIGEHPVGIPNNLMPYVHQVRSCWWRPEEYLALCVRQHHC